MPQKPYVSQVFCSNEEHKWAVWLFQHLINLIDSNIAVFSSFPDGEQRFTVDRQAHVLLDFLLGFLSYGLQYNYNCITM